MESITIRRVQKKDAAALLEIYRPYVENTAITFEYDVPSLEEFEGRIEAISAFYPYLAAENASGEIVGYAYAGRFHPRAAYQWSAESTVYLRQEERGRGTGCLLYQTLEECLKAQGILNMNACIAVPREATPYLTDGSIRFHEKMGFNPVGTFTMSGYKFGCWFDMLWMEKLLGEHHQDAAPPIPFENTAFRLSFDRVR